MSANCSLAVDDVPRRLTTLRGLLRPLSSEGGGPAAEHRSEATSIWLACFGPGPARQSIRDWRFKTRIEGLVGSYFEEWRASPDRRRYQLQRAYFSLFKGEEEILALHADPYEPAGAHQKYKCGPHVHVKKSTPPLSRAHLALNLTDLDKTLGSVANLTAAMKTALVMVNEQVLELFANRE